MPMAGAGLGVYPFSCGLIRTRQFTVVKTPQKRQSPSHLGRVAQRRGVQVGAGADLAGPEHMLERRLLLTGLVAVGFGRADAWFAWGDECSLVRGEGGLQFCDLREGTGQEPSSYSFVRCHYTGKLASNGEVFDSSYERRRPLTFKVGAGEVIQGWDKGILGADGIPPMKEGGKRRLVIPPELAYGKRGAGGGLIPPDATLIFDVELLGKKPPRG
eukprot:jgi/Botrbrau1/5704/Bobra.0071s0037.1